jgi:hypothetical protein
MNQDNKIFNCELFGNIITSHLLIINCIEPYTRNPQNKNLCEDIKDYNYSFKNAYNIINNSIHDKYISSVTVDKECYNIMFSKMTWVILRSILIYYEKNIEYFWKNLLTLQDINYFYRNYDNYISTQFSEQKLKKIKRDSSISWGSLSVDIRTLICLFLKNKIHIL